MSGLLLIDTIQSAGDVTPPTEDVAGVFHSSSDEFIVHFADGSQATVTVDLVRGSTVSKADYLRRAMEVASMSVDAAI